MTKLLGVVLSISLAACTVGGTEVGGYMDEHGSGVDTGSGSGSGSGSSAAGISGPITQDTTWSGAVLIGGTTSIEPGVTVTVSPGTTLTFSGGAALQINGTLDAQGTAASRVIIKPETTGFGGVLVNVGGALNYAYVEQTGGGILTAGGRTTITDTRMSRTAGDFLMMSGGTLDVSYSSVGLEPGQQDTTHCNMHFSGSGNVIKVTHTNVSTSSYGLMFYGGNNADFTFNNWFENMTDVDVQVAMPVSGNFSNGWFDGGAPSGTGITATNLSATRLVTCDGTNDAACAGPRG